MMQSNCQVCGNPMYSQSYCGTETDGSLNPEFCSNCYKGGQFYSRHLNAFTSNTEATPWGLFPGTGMGRGLGF